MFYYLETDPTLVYYYILENCNSALSTDTTNMKMILLFMFGITSSLCLLNACKTYKSRNTNKNIYYKPVDKTDKV